LEDLPAQVESGTKFQTSIPRRKELLGIDISEIRVFNGATTACCGQSPAGYWFHLWNSDNGYANIGAWTEKAAKAGGR
jgi:hypothetical protein